MPPPNRHRHRHKDTAVSAALSTSAWENKALNQINNLICHHQQSSPLSPPPPPWQEHWTGRLPPSPPPLTTCSYSSRHSRGQCCSRIEAAGPAAVPPQGLLAWRKEALLLFCFPGSAGWDPCQTPFEKKKTVAEQTDHKSADLAWLTK